MKPLFPPATHSLRAAPRSSERGVAAPGGAGAIAHAAYRPDIDGLRAIAILPVLLFHAHVPGLSGGYVGVDIFFVISGFLITRLIAREIDDGRFSIIRFYERRARRILPALSVMLAVVLAAAAILYLPGDFEGVPRSALAAILFLSNLWFFTDTGYFAGGADSKPLLHTWSLAVEEQFYIAFPLLLMLIARFAPGARKPLIAAAALGSLALCIAMRGDASGFAFYLPATRAWELLAGAMLALGVFPAMATGWRREAVAFAGFAAIAAAILTFTPDTPFPGIAALLPVAGAAILIHAAPGTLVGRALGSGPPRAIGLISYSLYLWHWPVIVFAEYATDAPLAGWRTVAAIGAAFILAFLSWRYVERPFRNPARVPARRIFTLSALAMGGLSLVALAMIAAGPWSSRFAPRALDLAAGRSDISPERGRCHDTAMRGQAPCLLGAQGATPDTLLWGDSHGVELAHILSLDAWAQGRALLQQTTSSCPPVLDWRGARDPRCARANADLFAMLRARPEIKRVYLAAFWASGAFADPDALARLDRTIAALTKAGKQVAVIGPVPPQPFDVPRRLAHAAGREGAVMGRDSATMRPMIAGWDALMARWRARGVRLIDPRARLCPTGPCAIIAYGRPLYFDSHHLSVAGARLVLRGEPY